MRLTNLNPKLKTHYRLFFVVIDGFSSIKSSGVTKGPTGPTAVGGGHTFLEIFPAYPLKSSNLFIFREGHQKGRGH